MTRRHQSAAMMLVLALSSSAVLDGQAPLRAGPRPIERIVPPADAAASDPALAEFRRRLLMAVDRRDFDGLRNALDQTHGAEYDWYNMRANAEEFVRQVRAWPAARQEGLWRDIRDALRPPVAVAESVVAYAPYLGDLQDPLGDEPGASVEWPYATVFILAAGVRMRSEPIVSARVLDSLSFETVRTLDEDSCTSAGELDGFRYCWQRVESARGLEGWIVNRYAFGQGSFWMKLGRTDGRWGIISFHRAHFR